VGPVEDQSPVGEIGEGVVEGLMAKFTGAFGYQAQGVTAAAGQDLHEAE